MDYGLVSIITPSYNTAKFIGQTIESVLNQTYENWEMIIVDDCSTDETDIVVKEYINDARIKYLKNEKNSGAAVSRNYALREAKGKWIAFLDSDDLWVSTKLEKQLQFMMDNDYHFSYTQYEEIDESNNSLNKYISGPKKITKAKMYAYCWPGCLTVMYDAHYIGVIQIKNIKKNNDYAIWLKVIDKANCYLLEKNLSKYRKRNGSISNQNKRILIKYHYKVFENITHKPLLSIFYTTVNIVFGISKKLIFIKREEVNK